MQNPHHCMKVLVNKIMMCTTSPAASPATSEISVGSPSPPLERSRKDYHQPLKKMKMSESSESDTVSSCNVEKIKSFSIADILGFGNCSNTSNQRSESKEFMSCNSQSKIVRPWDHFRDASTISHMFPSTFLHYDHRLTLDYHQQLQEHFRAQAQLLRHMNLDIMPSESGSERSSSTTSECCSPEINRLTADLNSQSQASSNVSKSKTANATPLDALFRMTTKPFDESQAEGKYLALLISKLTKF